MGKGSTMRTTNHVKFCENWDDVFGKKAQTEMDFRPNGDGKKS